MTTFRRIALIKAISLHADSFDSQSYFER